MASLIYERLMSDLTKRKHNMISSVVARAKDLYAEGYDLEQIFSILDAQGTNRDIIMTVLRVITDDNLSNIKPPKQYRDIIHIVESTIYSKPSKEIVKLLTHRTKFGQIMPLQHAETLDLEYLINYCQNNESPAVMEELHEALRPYMQNMMIHMNMLSQNQAKFSASNENEQKIIDKYFEWFGLWAPETQKAYIESVETYSTQSEEIDVLNDELGRNQTFCPMYKTEINVDNICGTCPFYEEIEDIDTGTISRRCNFRK